MMRVLMTTDAVGGVWAYALELAAALRLPEVQAKLQEQGVAPIHTAPGAAAERIAQELSKWRTVIAEAGVKPD